MAQKAILLSSVQLLVANLALDPVTDGGGLGLAVLAFLVAAPAVAPAAVEPLFGMRSTRGKSSENGGG
jgi:hypothetical protein